MTTHDIVKKLIGEIKPIGETNEDNRRMENLQNLFSLVEHLLIDIDTVADNLNSHQYSIRRAADKSRHFLNEMNKEFSNNKNFLKTKTA